MDPEKFTNNGPLLAWIVMAVFLLSFTLFGAALLWTYWADDIYSPAMDEASYPPPISD